MADLIERGLTPARRYVLVALRSGLSVSEIARAMGRSPFTVRNHIKEIYRTYDVRSRPPLLAMTTEERERRLVRFMLSNDRDGQPTESEVETILSRWRKTDASG